jgi:hypothetical protein
MYYIEDSKIGNIHSKPNVKYPMIRLPKKYSKIIGQRAHVYQTDHDGQLAFLVVPYAEEGRSSLAESKPRVSKPGLETTTYQRLSTIESKITELTSLILENTSCLQNQIKKEAPESGFEPESEPRQGSMIGRYTTRACISAVTA